MKISARTVIEGAVASIETGATTAHVTIEIALGQGVTAAITNEAIDSHGSMVGGPAYAVIKASNVMVGID